MTEDFLAWLWHNKLLNAEALITDMGREIIIVHPGHLNNDSGPDFFNARIQIDGILSAGNVEIHVKSSDWNIHRHQHDPMYNNVILHVVHECDRMVLNNAGNQVETLEIKDHYNHELYDRYLELNNKMQIVVCKDQLHKLNTLQQIGWLDRLFADRLESKLEQVAILKQKGVTSANEVLYHLLARNFGFKVNAEPFSMLARSIPYNVILKHLDSAIQIEALLFGQSGFLNAMYKDPYPMNLRREYQHLSRKYDLAPLQKEVWKFMRLHPNNFPTIRISQFAMVLNNLNLISGLLDSSPSYENVRRLFNISAAPYWDDHFVFDQLSSPKKKRLGSDAIHNIIINTLSVFLFWQGKIMGDQFRVDHAINLARKCPPENNRIIRQWKDTPVEINDAVCTQALYHLTTQFCNQKKCLNCTWGTHFISGR